MLLAAERGRVGERYLISERMIPLKEVVEFAADEAAARLAAAIDLGAGAVRIGSDGDPASPVDG